MEMLMKLLMKMFMSKTFNIFYLTIFLAKAILDFSFQFYSIIFQEILFIVLSLVNRKIKFFQ